jgi:hypothetical protein
MVAEANAEYVKAHPPGSVERKIAAMLYNQKQAKTAEALAGIQKLKIHLEAQDGSFAPPTKRSALLSKSWKQRRMH